MLGLFATRTPEFNTRPVPIPDLEFYKGLIKDQIQSNLPSPGQRVPRDHHFTLMVITSFTYRSFFKEKKLKRFVYQFTLNAIFRVRDISLRVPDVIVN